MNQAPGELPGACLLVGGGGVRMGGGGGVGRGGCTPARRHSPRVLRYHARVSQAPRERPDVTLLMNAAAGGDGRAAAELLPLVYEQLRKAAQLQMAGERGGGAGQTLSATALVHEAYLKLAGPREVPWAGRGHFYAAAAESMRRILIDRARAKAAAIRGGGEGGQEAARRAAINLAGLPDLNSETESAGFLILNEALVRLEGVDQEAAAVVRLRYFAGLSIEATAAALGVSAPTVKRSWVFARGWLKEAIEAGRF